MIQVFCLAALVPSAAPGAICNVPSIDYATVAAALADPSCDSIEVGVGSFEENLAIVRDVAIVGAGSGETTISGWVRVLGAATDAALNGLRVDATGATAELCVASGLDARAGARVGGLDLVVVGEPTPAADCALFADGFETGDTSVWSSTASS